MNRRLLAALAGSAAIVATLAPMATVAVGPGTRTERVPLAEIDPSFRPYLADANRQITVVLELAAEPALAVDGLSRTQQKTRAGAIKTSQQRLDARIKAAGGKITGRYQYAYNGIRVRAKGTTLAALAALPGVVAIRPLKTYSLDNASAVPYVGAPTAWQANGATGDGVTIAVIDSGIDYTHADFGGPGTVAAYDANNPAVIEPGSFPTGKVIAGYDFAGNDYDAGGEDDSVTPKPDADPLDCGDHGTHVAGTAAGQGVKTDHSTYSGPYNASLDAAGFAVAPGVAPEAKLVALKVFGCSGSTSLVVDALEWVAAYNVSNADGIDVVNMSLGAPFGSNTDPDAVATNNLVDQGVVVVASAGNESTVPYITGAPAAATKAISVAALDALPTLPLATIDLPGATDVPGNNQNAYPALPVSGTLHVVAGPSSGLSLGCTPDAYDAASAGKIVVVRRGVCVFVDKGAAAQAAGAIGIIVVNRTDTDPGELPTFIGYTPEYFEIPMVGTDLDAYAPLAAADGASITLAPAGTTANPTYKSVADFSSSGPRWGDSWLKPDVAAPGVNMLSSLNGSGWKGTTLSGTSMASPVTAGVAALVKDAHPGWSPLRVKAAIANTADASAAKVIDYDPLRAGAGVVAADRAVSTTVLATTSDGTTSLNFGYEQTEGGYSEYKWITITNTGDRTVRYELSASTDLVSISPSSVRVRARDTERVLVRASLSRSEVAALPTADQFITGDFGGLTSMAGVITATPTRSVAGAYALRVPYLLVPRGLADVDAELSGRVTKSGDTTSTTLKVRNDGGHAGYADVYALGILDVRGDGDHGMDVRAVGVQTLPGEVFGSTADDRSLQFAVNMHDRFSTAAPHEVDIAVDTDGDGEVNYFVIGIDNGLISAGAFDGVYISVILDATTFDVVDAWLADAPLNGSTLILPALASNLGLTEGDGAFSYWVAAFDGFTGGADQTAIAPAFDAYAPAQSTGDFVPVPARGRVSVPAWVTTSATGVKGWMVVTLDDRNGGSQADIVRFERHRDRD
ncbi:MAG TPA: S8 family serine peptidase [Candidatus Limnocylindrales bacterium]|nr:S8 family serine peptidase [Candidatus Limnocylindrales bacterium]